MAKDESDTFFFAQIGNPVPGEGAFNGYDEIIPVLLDRLQECLSVSLDISMEEYRAIFVNDAQIHGLCVQVDSAIFLVLFRVEFHSVPPCGCWDLYHTFGYEQGGLNEYQGAVADMAHLHFCPFDHGHGSVGKHSGLRTGTQERHAAKLWR
jgi:hypothetical protein